MRSLRRLSAALLAALLLSACACAGAEGSFRPIIAAGGSFIYARDDRGTVYCWGHNGLGQLGRGNRTQNNKKIYEFESRTPGLDIPEIRDIVCGCDYSYFLMNDGSIYGVGTGSNGQNIEQAGDRTTHVRLSFQDPTTVQLATGYGHTLLLNEAGEVYAWGRNHAGQVGNGTHKGPVREVVKMDLPRIVDIGCCGCHSAAVDEDGNLWMWGDNSYHQISPAKDKFFMSPVKINLDFKVREVELGGHHTAVVDEDGNLYLWGRNTACQIGISAGREKYVTAVTKADLPLPVRTVDCYGSLTWAVLEDGSLWTWGLNTYGQMAVGFNTGGESGLPLSHGELEFRGQPYSSKVLDGGVAAITIGDCFGAVLMEDGTLLTCGINKFGQLGRDAPYRGKTNFTLSPAKIRLMGGE